MIRRASAGKAADGRGKTVQSKRQVDAPAPPHSPTRVEKTPTGRGEPLAAVTAERDALKQSLSAAEARIAELEQARAHVVNRIDWLIDTLGSALEKRT